MENQTIKQLSNFNEMLYQRLQDLEHRIERLKIICSSLGGNDFSEINTQLSLLKHTVNNLSNIISTHEQQLQSIDANAITTALNKINNITNTVESNTAEISTLKNKTSDIDSMRQQSLDNKLNLENHIAEFNNFKSTTNAEMYANFSTIDVQLNLIKQENTNQNTQITNLENTTVNVETYSNEINNIKTQLDQLKTENELSFILNGTYILQSDLENILNGTYTI